jgi:hypothetical protein
MDILEGVPSAGSWSPSLAAEVVNPLGCSFTLITSFTLRSRYFGALSLRSTCRGNTLL